MPGRHLAVAALLTVLGAGCSAGGGATSPTFACEAEGHMSCQGDSDLRCVDGTTERVDCEHVCVEGVGCLRCVPDRVSCGDEHTLQVCSADGTSVVSEPCGETERCLGARCADLCAEAAAAHDYVGCEYWAVPLANPQLRDGFRFAVVLANPAPFTARVTVEGGGLDGTIEREIPAGETEVVALPWIAEVSQLGAVESGGGSVLATAAAYRIRSDVPVLATQWNPLEYRLGHDECGADSALGCFSQTNDASLLLPVHALGRGHRVVSYTSLASETTPAEDPTAFSVLTAGRGFLAVVAVEPGDTEVTIEAASALEPVGDAPRIEAGEARTYRLAQGDVLQLVAAAPRDEEECAPVGRRRQCASPRLDPTGTLVSSDHPVAVFSGHTCAYVPFDRPACDHLEEQLLPVVALGRTYVLGRTFPQHQSPVPNLLRVLSAADGNRVRFEPPIHPEIVLDAGEHVLVEQSEPVRIEGSDRLLVAQLAVGMEYSREAPNTEGDPALLLAPPVEQWRRSYVFQVPGTYTSAYASVVAPAGVEVRLDDEPLEEPTGSLDELVFYDVRLAAEAQAHRIEAAAPIGLTLHGYAPWTSYMHVGGLTVAPVLE